MSSNDQHGNTVGEPFQTGDIMPSVLRALDIPLTHPSTAAPTTSNEQHHDAISGSPQKPGERNYSASPHQSTFTTTQSRRSLGVLGRVRSAAA